ncbi:MAG TPA: DUF3048 domain-containing protein [bacterium]|nr:DUF3048 domain-containing protein [bacterium]HQL34611.1 DUF3048 domain-containing protein [bacterium]
MEDGGRKYLSKKGRAILISALFILVFSGLGLYYLVFSPNWQWLSFLDSSSSPTSTEVPLRDEAVVENDDGCVDCPISWLNGLPVANEKEASAFPVAVVIDNDVLARPQNALSLASLVYEAPVEGGMTRYLAIFPANIDVSAVGPVRSARPYFVAWAEELRALFIHCGGSPEALDLLKSANLYDLNEFYNGNYFWRETSAVRMAPHNVLTSGDNWRSYLSQRGLDEKKADSWLFKKEVKPEKTPEPKDISLRFSANFQALWRYLPESNSYQRYFNGVESRDLAGLIQAKNVIIQKVESRILDVAGRLALDLEGEGRAEICLDGICRSGFWRHRPGERTRYYYDDGAEIQLNPGITWIEVADSNTHLE